MHFIDHLLDATNAYSESEMLPGFYFEEGGCYAMAYVLKGVFDRLCGGGGVAILPNASHAYATCKGKLYDYQGEAHGAGTKPVSVRELVKAALANMSADDFRNDVRMALEIVENAMERANETPTGLTEAFHLADLDDSEKEGLYQTFKTSYEAETGAAWNQGKFMSRAGNWTFYGDEKGYVAVRKQASGMKKLVGVAGDPKSILKGLAELQAEGGPIWGAVSAPLAAMAKKRGMIVPHLIPGGAFFVKTLAKSIPASVFGGYEPTVTKDGGFQFAYEDVGVVTKYLIGNKAYFLSAMKLPHVAEKLKEVPGLGTVLRFAGLNENMEEPTPATRMIQKAGNTNLPAKVTLIPIDDQTVEIRDIRAHPAGRGAGRATMAQVIKWADTLGVTLEAWPVWDEDVEDALIPDALENWYLRLGFKWGDNDRMRRVPEKIAVNESRKAVGAVDTVEPTEPHKARTFDFRGIRNRRFMFDPKKRIFVVGDKTGAGKGKGIARSHAEEYFQVFQTNAGYDSMLRGWMGNSGDYPHGLIQFAPSIGKDPDRVMNAITCLEHFVKCGATDATMVIGFGDKWEQPLGSILKPEADR